MKYVLTGSLGNITRPLAEKLIAAGHDVTIISSSEERSAGIIKLGAKPAIGNLEDSGFLTATFAGADAVYTMVPPKWDAADWKRYIAETGKNIADAVKNAGIKKVVNLSSVGAHMPTACGPVSGLHFVELAFNALPDTDVKHLRPAYFYLNMFSYIGLIKGAGILGNNYGGDTVFPMTHPNDIAAVAAAELLSLDFKGKSILYTASDERNSKEIAKVLGTAIGKADLPYVEFKDEDVEKAMVQAGLSKEVASNYAEMGRAIRTGEMAAEYKKQKPPFGPTSLEDFAKEFAEAFANS
jgi:uncharacterized protein YbjT (DUF2867 family)